MSRVHGFLRVEFSFLESFQRGNHVSWRPHQWYTVITTWVGSASHFSQIAKWVLACRDKENPGVFFFIYQGMWKWMEWAYHHFFFFFTPLHTTARSAPRSFLADALISKSPHQKWAHFLFSHSLQTSDDSSHIPLRTLPTSATLSRQRYLFAQFSKHPVRE